MKYTLSIFFISISLLGGALAVEAANYKVTPLVIDRIVSPRDIITETIVITNNNNYTLTVFPTVNEISQTGDELEANIARGIDDRTTSIASWIDITRAGVDIKKGETAELTVRIQINPQAAPGEYHALIGFGSGRNRPLAEAQVAAGTAPAVVVRLEIKDEAVEQVKLGSFLVDRFVFSSTNSSTVYTITNPGDKTVVPTGEIIYYNARGAEVASVPVNPDNLSVSPGESITLSSEVPLSEVMGKYKAFLSVEYGNSQTATVYDTAFFYMIPWYQVLIFVGGFSLLSLLLLYLLHRRYRAPVFEDEYASLPFHVYEGNSDDQEHDINLKS